MKNKKLLTTTALTTIIALTGVTSKLYAQSKNFSGPYISIGATNQNSDSKISNDSPAATPTAAVYGSSTSIDAAFVGFNSTTTTVLSRVANSLAKSENDILGTASIGFMLPVDNNFLIGIQGSYIPTSGTKNYSNSYTISTVAAADGDAAGGALSSFTITNTTGTQSVKLEDKESWSISLVPSYAVNNDLMLFGKIGYTNFKQTAKINFSNDAQANVQKTEKLDGYVLGVGARYNLDKNLFLSFNFDASKFDEYTVVRNDLAVAPAHSATANATAHPFRTTIDNDYIYNTTISIGYKF